MAIRKVARMGHPVLRMPAKKVEPEMIDSEMMKRLIQDMKETMAEYGGIGLAAPQIHESWQIALIGYDEDNERYEVEEEVPLRVLINPTIEVLDQTLQGFWEGCLSVPGLRGYVERPRKIRVSYLDEAGRPQSLVAEDFTATVFQHELDHLKATLYIDKLKDSRLLMFESEFEKFIGDDSEILD